MFSATLTLIAGIVLIVGIIAVGGYFVAQEFAYMSVDRARLAAGAAAGDPAAERALAVTGRTSFMLSGAQLGITVTGLLVGYVAEPLVGASLGVLLGGLSVPAAVSVSVGTVGALVVATVVQMIFGELYPKNLAIAAPEPLALRLSRSTLIYLAVFGWLIAIFDFSANLLLKLLRVTPVHDVDSSVSPEDLKRAVADSRESGDLPDDLSLLIDRVLDFPDDDVEHAMMPRAQVATVRPDATLADLRARMAHAHSRYPVVDAAGEPVGVVELVDLLRSSDPEDAPVATIMRPPVLVPALMPLPDALAEMGRAHAQMVCAIDEYGGFAGILTTEDIAEELIGEITDEHDADTDDAMVADGDRAWRADGGVHLDEVRRTVGHDLPDGDYETLAGLTIAVAGDFPAVGQTVRVRLPDDPADLVNDRPVRRFLDVETLTIARHVPHAVRVVLREFDDTGPSGAGR
ncbi:hemolysin family protein [Gordonia caeni]|uniref:Hemolysin family protein n=1 Tax=Gordonia caeni TaxID=1007097 RepID=A0ABP7NUJ8_9ACTN